VEKVDGKLVNAVIATFPGVGQFWKYNAEEYMRLPLYSRDYPPCCAC
jgi:branched-chain amino acid transport system substrate-binding protein